MAERVHRSCDRLRALVSQVLLAPTLADTLQPSLSFASSSPIVATAVFLLLYVLWLPFAALSRALSHALTSPVTAIIIVVFIVCLGRLLARSLVFPCSISMVSKGIEREIAARMRQRTCAMLAEVDELMMLGGGGAPGPSGTASSIRERAAPPMAHLTSIAAVLRRQHDDGSLSAHAAFYLHYLELVLVCAAMVEFTLCGAPASAVGAAGDSAAAQVQVPDAVYGMWGGVESSVALPSAGDRRRGGQPSPGCSESATPALLLTEAPPIVSLPHVFDSKLGNAPRRGETAALVHALLNTRGLSVGGTAAIARKLIAMLQYLSAWLEVLPIFGDVYSLRAVASAAGMSEQDVVHFSAKRLAGAASAAGQAATAALVRGVSAEQGGSGAYSVQLPPPGAPPRPGSCSGDPELVASLLTLLTGSLGVAVPAAYGAAASSARPAGSGPAATAAAVGGPNASAPAQPPPPRSVRRVVGKLLGPLAAGCSYVIELLRQFTRASKLPSPVCGLDFMRSELLLCHFGSHLWLRGASDNRVDAVYIPALAKPREARVAWLLEHGMPDIAASVHSGVDAAPPVEQQFQPAPPQPSRHLQQQQGHAGGSGAVPTIGATASTMTGEWAARGSSSSGLSDEVTDEDAPPTSSRRGLARSLGRVGVPSWLVRSCLGDYSLPSSPSPHQLPTASSMRGGVGSAAHVASFRSLADIAELAAAAPAAVLICNPNAGLYEITHRNSEWIDLYSSIGLDVVLWNYRGYGRSAGSPSPSAICADAEAIVKYLRTRLRVRRVVVHGESIGGVAACHLARLRACDVLVADRNFDSLPRTARAMMGSLAEAGLLAVTRWSGSNAAAYLASTAPAPPSSAAIEAGAGTAPPSSSSAAARGVAKIMLSDADDQVIRFTSSLSSGVAAAVLAHLRPQHAAPSVAALPAAGGGVPPSPAVASRSPHTGTTPLLGSAPRGASLARALRAAGSVLSEGVAPLLVSTGLVSGGVGRNGALPAAADEGDDLTAGVQRLASYLYFLLLRAASDAWPHMARGRVPLVTSPDWETRARRASASLASSSPHSAAGTAAAAGGYWGGGALPAGIGSSGDGSGAVAGDPEAAVSSALQRQGALRERVAAMLASAPVAASAAAAATWEHGTSAHVDPSYPAASSEAHSRLYDASSADLVRCLSQHGIAITPASVAFPIAATWASSAKQPQYLEVLAMVASAGAAACTAHEQLLLNRLLGGAGTEGDAAASRSGELPHHQHQQVRAALAEALHATATLSPVHDAAATGVMLGHHTHSSSEGSGRSGQPGAHPHAAPISLHILLSGAPITEAVAAEALALDTELLGSLAAGGSGAPGLPSRGAAGPDAALLLCLAGLTNGAGQRLGDAAADGIPGVAAFLQTGLLWGWDLQGGTTPTRDLHRTAARSLGAAAPSAPAPATACDCGHSHAGEEGGEAATGPTVPGSFLRTAPFLLACNETGICTALRRLLALHRTVLDHASGRLTTGAPPQPQSARLPAFQSLQRTLGSIEESTAAVLQLLHFCNRLATSREGGAAGSSALRGRGDPRRANSDAGMTLPGLGDRLLERMASREGLFVPLTCGHNAAWGAVESSMALRAVMAALYNNN